MNSLFSYLFPVTLLAFIGTSVAYISAVFSNNNRWIFLGLLFIQQIVAKHRRNSPVSFTACLFLYSVWCISTTFWSERSELSFMKSALFFILTFTMISAGQYWVARKGLNKSFDYLIPLSVVAFAAAIPGYFINPHAFDGKLFQGYVYGSNMFGSLVAMTIPFTLWRCYLNWSRPRMRNIWVGLFLLSMLFLLMSMSRSAMLMALLCLTVGLFSVTINRLIIGLYFIIVIVAFVYSFNPGIGSKFVKKVVYKNADTISYTRVQTWGDSLEKATLGGWFGVGYGVSIGSASRELQGLTAVGYGREKGNSQLAIIEETGVVGLILYILTLVSLFQVLLSRYIQTENKDLKVALGLFIGALTGMVVQSVFEAWWVAPGAPESAAFWALVGCALGLAALDTKDSPKFNPTRL